MFLLVNVDLRSQSQCILFTYAFTTMKSLVGGSVKKMGRGLAFLQTCLVRGLNRCEWVAEF